MNWKERFNFGKRNQVSIKQDQKLFKNCVKIPEQANYGIQWIDGKSTISNYNLE